MSRELMAADISRCAPMRNATVARSSSGRAMRSNISRGYAHRGDGVVFAGSLPHVVKEKRQIKDWERRGFFDEAGKAVGVVLTAVFGSVAVADVAFVPGRVAHSVRTLQFGEGGDGDQGVLIHGVAMVEIAGDQGIEVAEFGEDGLENSGRVHFAEREIGVREGEDFADRRPLGLHGRQMGQQAVLGVGRQSDAVARDEGEEALDEGGVGDGLLRRAEVDAFAQDRKIGVGEARGAVSEAGEQGGVAALGAFQKIHAGAVDGTGAAEVVAHEAGGIFGIDLVLHGEIEGIVIAVGDLVQTPANAEEHVARREEFV